MEGGGGGHLSKSASPTVPLVRRRRSRRRSYKTVPYHFNTLKCTSNAMKPTITLLLPLVACCDVYLQEARTQCETTFGLFSCAKYRLSEYVSAIPVLTSNTTGVVSFVDVGAPERCEAPGSFRQLPDDSETSKFLKFLGRRLRGLFRRQGLLLRLPDGARAVEEEDGTTKVRKYRGRARIIVIAVLNALSDTGGHVPRPKIHAVEIKW